MTRAGQIAILNGPNLDHLGNREPHLYGSLTYEQLCVLCRRWAADLGFACEIHQANGEGALIELVHEAGRQSAGILLNAAGYTHTSVALRDAVLCQSVPVVEVHLTNPWRREPFRRRNLLVDVVLASVCGFGAASYHAALVGLAGWLRERG